jgi:leucyl aminopeptidase
VVASFLKSCVEKDVKWVHLDIAGALSSSVKKKSIC